jgi:hypothetical protein
MKAIWRSLCRICARRGGQGWAAKPFGATGRLKQPNERPNAKTSDKQKKLDQSV